MKLKLIILGSLFSLLVVPVAFAGGHHVESQPPPQCRPEKLEPKPIPKPVPPPKPPVPVPQPAPMPTPAPISSPEPISSPTGHSNGSHRSEHFHPTTISPTTTPCVNLINVKPVISISNGISSTDGIVELTVTPDNNFIVFYGQNGKWTNLSTSKEIKGLKLHEHYLFKVVEFNECSVSQFSKVIDP